MDLKLVAVLLSIAGLVGIGLGYFIRYLVGLGKRGSVELDIKRKLLEAQEEANKILETAETRAEQQFEEIRTEAKAREEGAKKTEERLIKKEELLDKRQSDIDNAAEELKAKAAELAHLKSEAEHVREQEEAKLQEIARMTADEAREALLEDIEKKSEEDLMMRMRKLEMTGKEALEKKAQDILVTAIHRLGSSVSSDIMSSTVALPSDDVKGKIIGKEGRNIKAFERATGVEVVIDDTPGSIVISSFDPVRRAVAKLALEHLIKDGRIQPARIEEESEKARLEVNNIIKEQGEKAAYEAGVFNLDPRVISILGRLHFRTSYGQNVLQHSVEMAHIAGMLAEELGADVSVAKAGALVHDIGKAVDHEIQGTHVEIGRRILQKFGADEAIVKAMQAHHEEYPYETVESVIVQVADAVSGSRPGARRDTVENYLKRLADLEAIANGFEGIEKAYAIQAGREIRIFVKPETVSDLEAKQLARDIANKVETELKYPGEIKVNVIREQRVIEYAR
ncbi:MAG TPA: ribonuclease Y [Candidatus Paceibacterota bacterium]|nr:ribonuclease Y [Candidatus Paceibacterota bacterium]